MKNIFLIATCLIIFQSCKPTKIITPPVVADSLPAQVINPKTTQLNGLDTSWELQNQFGAQLNSKYIPQLIINSAEKKFYGNTGCNRMSGTFAFDEVKIKFNEQIITTKMACEGYNENDFINTLFKVNTYKIQDSVLELNQNDIVLLTFRKK